MTTDKALGKFTKKFKAWFIQDVPEHLYACQGCNKTSCTELNWKHCEYRRYCGNRSFLDK